MAAVLYCRYCLHVLSYGDIVAIMAIRLLPYERVYLAEKLPAPTLTLFSKTERERHQIIYGLWKLLGVANPDSSIHAEHSPHDSDERLYLTLSMLPLDFARRVHAYAKDANQHQRDLLQISLRFLRSGKDKGVVISESRVSMLEMYLSALPLFVVLAEGDVMAVGGLLINHAEVTDWEAHRSIGGRRYPLGYFLYTNVWPKKPLPNDDDLAWMNDHALELAKLPIGQRGRFDRNYCEVLLESSASALISGAL